MKKNYYKMNDLELEIEASKWNIRAYGTTSGVINRQIIIDALIKKDAVIESRVITVILLLGSLTSVLSIVN